MPSSTDANLRVIESLYAAFGRGDIAFVLSLLAEDIVWGYNVDPKLEGVSAVDRMKTFRGPRDVGNYFEALRGIDIHDFRITGLLAGDARVAALVQHDLTVKKTGKRYAGQQIHLWELDEAGKIKRLTHFDDTATVLAASRA